MPLRFAPATSGALRACALATSLSLPVAAFALVGGAGVDTNLGVDSPWAGVGSLSVGPSGLFTGTLIAPGYVLTAAHVVAGVAPSAIQFRLHAGDSTLFSASQVFVSPGYTGTAAGNPAGDPTAHDDLAIVRLAGAAPAGVTGYSIFQGNLNQRVLHFVSYAGSTSSRKTGENLVDGLLPDTAGRAEVYVFDFDGPDLSTNRFGANIPASGTLGATREASLVGGDSGSAAFVQVGGQWQLAGINTFQITFQGGPTTTGAFGTGGGGMVLSAYAPWITSVITAPVPEPASWSLMLAGAALLAGAVPRGAHRGQRRRSARAAPAPAS